MPDRAVIWCAVSDPSQAKDGKESLPAQKRDGLDACTRENLRVIAVLEVEGFSRDYVDIRDCAEDMAAAGIPAMQDLYTMMRSKAFDVLVFRKGDRFGRTQTLFSYVVEYIIRVMGGRLYETSRKRWIDTTNFREYISTEGYRAASELDNFKERSSMGMIGRMHLGLTMSRAPLSHRVIHDPITREPVRLEVREELRRTWDDAARLIMERPKIGWGWFEATLYERSGHINPDTGRKWSKYFFKELFYNPYVWGIAAFGYSNQNGIWVFDETEPVPEGVQVDRDPLVAIPPLYGGQLAEELKVELRMRARKPGRKPSIDYKFSGLLRCGDCGRTIAVRNSRTPASLGWGCYDRWIVDRRGCTNTKIIPDAVAQGQIDEFLKRWAELETPDLLPLSTNHTNLAARRIEQIARELELLEGQINRIIALQIAADENVRENYTQALKQASERKAILQADLVATRRTTESAAAVMARRNAHQELRRIGLANFWGLPSGRINQILHQIMGRSRFVALGGRFVDVQLSAVWCRRSRWIAYTRLHSAKVLSIIL